MAKKRDQWRQFLFIIGLSVLCGGLLLAQRFIHATSTALVPMPFGASAGSPRPTQPTVEQSQPGTLAPLAVDTVSDPQVTGYPDSRKVVRDSDGNVYIAYRKKLSDGSQHIFVATLLNTSRTFTTTAKSIETEIMPQTQRVPSLAIDANNTLHVVWYGTDANSTGANERQIKYTRAHLAADRNLTWTSVVEPAGAIPGFDTISPAPTLWQEHPVIFAGPKQTLYVVWEGKDSHHPENAQVKWIKSRDGGATWSAWQNIPGDPQRYYSRPTIIATSDGRKLYVLAYATGHDETAQIVWTQSLDNDNDPGDTWDRWHYVTDNDVDGGDESSQDQRHLSAVMDSNQVLHLVWRQKPEKALVTATTQIHYATYPQQGKWSLATMIMPNRQLNQSFPSLTVDKDNRLWAVWSETSTLAKFPNEELATGEIHAAKHAIAGKWQPIALPVASTGQRALYPSLRWQRYGARGGVDLVWLESRVSDPTNTTCVEQGQVKCTLYYTNLAGQ